ncbi:crotonase/enoyl-CoA hydratase family protein, partial [Mesorhizobium shangrilense]
MSEELRPVLTERRGHILIVTINRPQVRNAFDTDTAMAMQAAMDLLDGEEDLFVGVLTGAGGNFSSGMDLKAAAKDGPPPLLARGDFGILGRPPRKPLIAAVEGYAVAGGFETCLACDMIVAARDAKFGLPEVRHNLLATNALVRLPLRMPYHLAMELALTGAFKDAAYFERFGVVNYLTEPGEALEEALKLAQSLLENGPLALAASKEIMFQSLDGQAEEDRLKQLPIVQKVFGSEDEREGLRAFAEKRKPVWQG